jgi:CDP-glycerol glycerophosphotransferase (TagB/SpsB family)
MVSLGSSLRVGFNKKKGYKLHKTVVSSELEAQHFIDLAGMTHDDLYVTGLAKFDKAVRNPAADKIIIMPTWRRWETNQARQDLHDTGYYRMVETMLEGVPEELRDKVIILPHPLIADRFSGDESSGRHVVVTDQYDPLLRDCALLITDYSSIAYDAYYRGANVIFYWKDKDECMEHYGEGTKLMLNEDNVFGPVCMDAEDICSAVKQRYGSNQDPH